MACAQVDELRTLHETEHRRRVELERALRDAAAMFKTELFEKQVRRLRKPLRVMDKQKQGWEGVRTRRGVSGVLLACTCTGLPVGVTGRIRYVGYW